MVESVPSKHSVVGSIPIIRSNSGQLLALYFGVAQLVERLTVNQQVAGSSPAAGAIYGGEPPPIPGDPSVEIAPVREARLVTCLGLCMRKHVGDRND